MKLFLGSPTFQVPTPYSTTYSGYAWARSKITTSFFFDCDSTNFFKTVSLCRVCLCEYVVLVEPTIEALLCPMTSWICQWKPFWIPVGDSSQKAYLEEWVRVGAVPSEEPSPADQGDVIPETVRCRRLLLRYRWNQPIPWKRHTFGNVLRHHCLCCGHVPKCDFIRPQQLSPSPERHELLYSCEDILSGLEVLASSVSDHFTMWGKMSPVEISAEHVVDIHKVEADFRDAFERNQSSSSQTFGVNKYCSSQSPVQKRLSIYKWNPGPRRGKEDAFEKQIGRSDILLPCTKHLSMLNTIFFMNGFT